MTSDSPHPRRKKLILGALLAVLILALLLGLSLGLTIGRRDDNNDDSSPAVPTASAPSADLPWYPQVGDSWQIILSGKLNLPEGETSPSVTPDVKIFTLDLFDTPKSTIDTLHGMGKRVICYFSAGSYEDWREDKDKFQQSDLGSDLDGWPGEKWLKLDSENVRNIMKDRLQMAKDKGCDGVDPDNVDGFDNDNGLDLTPEDSVSFVEYLSSVTSDLKLALGLKNAASIIENVLPVVQFSVNEECAKYEECSDYRPFIDSGKPVFHIEYPEGSGTQEGVKQNVMTKYCTGEGSEDFTTLLKNMNLDGWVQTCDGKVSTSDIIKSDHEERRR